MKTDTPRTDATASTMFPDGSRWVQIEDYRKLERERDEARKQRDRLAEELKQIYNVSLYDYDTMPEVARKKYREVVLAIADKALQSITQQTKL